MVELLIASVLTSTALLLCGAAFTNSFTSSASVNTENERQAELNRALNFIRQEILEARSVEDPNAPSPGLPPDGLVYPSMVKSGTEQKVLRIELNGGSLPVVYYTAEPADGEPWRKPRAIYRWGPRFDDTGAYENVGDPSTWEHEILVDSMAPTEAVDVDCPTDAATGKPWPIAPSQGSVTGFYACIAPNKRSANLVQVGNASKPLSAVGEPYKLNQQTSSRSTVVPVPTVTPSRSTPLPIVGPEITRRSKITLRPFGGQITCGTGGVLLATETRVIWTIPGDDRDNVISEVIPSGGLTKDVPEGTSIRLVGRALPTSRCSGAGDIVADSTRDRGTQVMTLFNESPVPDIEPFDGQDTIAEMAEPVFDPLTKTVKIEDNQILFLFEVGIPYAERNRAAYDLQDIVILADVVPVNQ